MMKLLFYIFYLLEIVKSYWRWMDASTLQWLHDLETQESEQLDCQRHLLWEILLAEQRRAENPLLSLDEK